MIWAKTVGRLWAVVQFVAERTDSGVHLASFSVDTLVRVARA